MSDSIVSKLEKGVDPEAQVAPLGHVRVFTSERGTGEKQGQDYPLTGKTGGCPDEAKLFARRFVRENHRAATVEVYNEYGFSVYTAYTP